MTSRSTAALAGDVWLELLLLESLSLLLLLLLLLLLSDDESLLLLLDELSLCSSSTADGFVNCFLFADDLEMEVDDFLLLEVTANLVSSSVVSSENTAGD